jgi:hypothetical protein
LFAAYHDDNEIRGRRVYFVETGEHRNRFTHPRNRLFSKLIVPR